MPDSIVRILYRWRVRAGAVSAILALVLAEPGLTSLIAGIFISFCGLALRAWSCGHIHKERELTISGPYQFTRNPLYLGNLSIGAGFAVGSGSWWAFIVLAVYFSVFYPVVIIREKKKMQSLFPEKYREYDSKVPLFIPRLSSSSGQDRKFSWARYHENHEIRAFTGVMIFWILIAGKLFIL